MYCELCLSGPSQKSYFVRGVFGFSQNALQNYMAKARIKENQGPKNMGTGSGEGRDDTKALGQGDMASHSEVKAHHLLVLLLRLRQICCHPGLIKSMLDQDTKLSEGIEEDGEEIDLISAVEDMNISNTGNKDTVP